MAEQKFLINGGFFDSVNKDRLYSADQMNKPYNRVITEGIFATPAGTPSTDFQVLSANNAMNIVVKKGDGLLGNKWIENPSDQAITVSTNTSIVPRRDSIIIQVDKTQGGRICNIVYREGTAKANPMPPDLSTNSNIVELRVANIYVAPSATYIGQDAITDLRGSSECPWITSLIKQVDTSTLFIQWQTAFQNYYNQETEAFNAFMETLTEQLTVNTNVVMLESHYTSTTEVTEIPINITGFDQTKDVLMVFVNRLRATPNIDYTISTDNTKITLTNSIVANQSVNFLVLKSVVGADDATAVQLMTQVNTKLTEITTDSGWINFTLENGTSFDDTTTPAIRKYNNQVFIRGAIKGLDTLNVPICTLPTNMRPAMNKQYSVTAFADGTIAANCVLEIRTTGSIYLVAKSGTIPATAMLPISTELIVD